MASAVTILRNWATVCNEIVNVLFLKKLYSPVGGSEALTYQWARRLAERGHRVRVLCLMPLRRRYNYPPSDLPCFETRHVRTFVEGGVTVHQIVPYLGAAGQLLDMLPFSQLIRRNTVLRLAEGCDLVHCICREYTAAAQMVARAYGVPLVLTPLPHPGQPFSGDSRKDAASYRAADGIVAMTYHEKRWYEDQGVATEKVAVVASGAVVGEAGDAAGFRARHKIDGPSVLFVGRQERYKGHLATLEAAPIVWRTHPRAHFIFIGEKGLASHFYDPLARYRDSRVIDLGLASNADKADAYAACDVFCMPSTHETLGLTYLEAWSYGKPVVGCDIPVMREVISNGGDGLLVDQRASHIATAIHTLLDNPERSRRMGELGRQKTLTTYSWSNVIDKLESFYSRLRALGPQNPD